MTPEQEYFEQFFRTHILYLRMEKLTRELRLLQLKAEDAVLRLDEISYQLKAEDTVLRLNDVSYQLDTKE